jgi:valyl-tRNA synthetase
MNDQGRAQVRATAEKLHDKDIALIVSSDLGRCRETSKIIAERTGAPVIFDTALRERFQGPMEGMYREEAQKKYGNLYPYEEEVAGAENYRELEERVWEAFRTHRAAHGHKNVVVVSHSGVMRVLVKRIKNLAPSEAMSRPTIPNTEVITLDVLEKPCKNCGGDLYEQDPDVFDTWFSSGQWPFATLMAPSVKRQASFTNKRSLGATKTDFERFYPTDVMETAYDILFFWVARMAMLGLYCTGKVPFRKVYLHGLVRDKDRQKMSKSKGNVLDPLGVAETYGTDALRMALVIGNAPGNDIVISEDKIRGYRNFATKLWNISRFVLLNRPSGAEANATLTAADRKHLAALANVKKRVTKYIEELKFHLAAETLYHYVWHTFADKIIEEYKPHLKAAIGETAASAEALGMPARFSPGGAAGAKGSGRALRGSAEAAADARKAYFVLESILLECLTMLHPFMPFITEAIYQKTLPPKARGVQGRPRELLMIRRWHDTIKS